MLDLVLYFSIGLIVGFVYGASYKELFGTKLNKKQSYSSFKMDNKYYDELH